jgi:hypothetical protein
LERGIGIIHTYGESTNKQSLDLVMRRIVVIPRQIRALIVLLRTGPAKRSKIIKPLTFH